MNVIFAMFNGWEIVLILALALVLFGAKKLPELARGLGQGIREFKKSTREITDELESAVDFNSPPPPPQRKLPREERVAHSDAAGSASDSASGSGAEPDASSAGVETHSEQKA